MKYIHGLGFMAAVFASYASFAAGVAPTFGLLNSAGMYHESCDFDGGKASVFVNSTMIRAKLDSEKYGWHVDTIKINALRLPLTKLKTPNDFQAVASMSLITDVAVNDMFSLDNVKFEYPFGYDKVSGDLPVHFVIIRDAKNQRIGATLSVDGYYHFKCNK